MMTEVQKKMAEMLGLSEKDFRSQQTDKERIAELELTTEDIILLMADLIGGM